MIPFRRLCISVLICAAAVQAADFGALKPEGYVSDFARAIDPGTKAELEQYCIRVDKATGAEMAIVTLPTLEGEPIEDVANLLYRRWGVGKKGKDEGVLLLLVIRDRRSRIEVGYGLEPIIPDGFAGSVLREMRPALRNQNYGDALSLGAHTIATRIAQAKNITLETKPTISQRRQRHDEPIPWPIIVGGLFLLFWMFAGGGRGGRGRRGGWGGGGGLLPGIILGHMMGRRGGMWGPRGGGGFGGYDTGDSFGGFGGGDSGGGGASSNW
jgi:uncharacterized protein